MSYNPGKKSDLKVPVGVPLKDGMITSQAMKTRSRIVKRVDASHGKYHLSPGLAPIMAKQ